MPRTSSTSRARRIRRVGLLGLLLTTLLTPAGIIVSTVTAAALIGGAFHLSRAKPETAVTPLQPVSMKRGNPQHLNIERDGKTLALVIAEDTPGNGSGAGSFDPANPLFAGLTRGDPARRSAAGGGMPGSGAPGGGYAPGGGNMPHGAPSTGPSTGPAPNPPSSGGPTGMPPSGGIPPTGSPPVVGGPRTPPGKGEPTTPDETKPTVTDGAPNPDKPQPTNGLPPDTLPGPGPDTLPGLPTLPLAGTPLDTQTPPPGKQLATQPNAVPEPSMLGLMLLGVAALAWTGRRRPHPLSPA
ncbi:MAG: PEP-CTERM sorting domain-containing protein [Thiobacillus sp.]